MSVETGVWGVVFLFVLLALRIPVALALIAVSFSGVAILLSLAPAVGITIGLLTALLYCVVILLISWFRPDIAPPYPLDAVEIPAREALIKIWPVLLLMAIVFGGLFSGVFTATEAGAIGAIGSILIAFATGQFTFTVLKTSLIEALITSSSLLIIGVGATMFTRFLGLTGLTGAISSVVTGAELSYYELMLVVVRSI